METAPETTIDPHGADDAGEVVNPALVAASKPDPTPAFKATDDGNQVEYGGKKYIREEALHQERQTRQEYQNTLEKMKPLMPEFEQFLQQRQNGNRATVQRATDPVESDYTPDELTGYAITRGYYDAENKPDLRRAQADLDIMTAIADRRAGKAVQPIAATTTRDRALQNVQRAMAQTFTDGQPIAEPQYLQAAFDAVPDEIKADPNVSNILTVVAAGLQALDDRKNGRSRGRSREPLFREGSGRSFGAGGGQLDALGRAAARARGKTDAEWAKLSGASGGTNFGGDVLEEV